MNNISSILRTRVLLEAGNPVRDQIRYKDHDQVSNEVRDHLHSRVLVLIRAQLKEDLFDYDFN